jgi:hypothetical protein
MNHKNPVLIAIGRVPLTVGLAVSIVGTVLIAAFILLPPPWHERLKFIAAVVAGGSTVYAAFYAGTAVRVNVARDMLQRAFDVLAAQNTPDFVKTFQYLESHAKQTPPAASIDWAAATREDPQLEQSLRLVLASFEDMSHAIREGQIDERTIYLSNCQIMPMALGLLRPYVNQVREQRKTLGYMAALEAICDSWATGNFYTGGAIPVEDRIPFESFYTVVPKPPKK